LSNVGHVAVKDFETAKFFFTFIFAVLLQFLDCMRVGMLKGINFNYVNSVYGTIVFSDPDFFYKCANIVAF